MSIYEALSNFIGSPPPGSESVLYVFAIIFGFFFLSQMMSLIYSIFSGRGRR